MPRTMLLRRLAVVAVGAGMLGGAALGMADGSTTPATRSAPAQPLAETSPADAPPEEVRPAKPWRITSGLGELQPAKPMSPEEVDPYRVTKYAIDNGAIAVTFDPDTDVLSVLFPLESDPPPPPETKMNVSVRTASFPTAAYDAAADDLTSFEWSPDARKYGYAISLDAATGLHTVDTDAPAEVTDAIEARHPGVFRFNRGAGPTRFLPYAGPAPSGQSAAAAIRAS